MTGLVNKSEKNGKSQSWSNMRIHGGSRLEGLRKNKNFGQDSRSPGRDLILRILKYEGQELTAEPG
jgi:hypothetical protein